MQSSLSLSSLFRYKKGMTKSELFPFLETTDDLGHLLLLCRSSHLLISEHYLADNSDRLFRVFLTDSYLIPFEEMEIIRKDHNIIKRDDMKKIDGKVIKGKGSTWGYYRYCLNIDKFEILTYSGAGWAWTNDARYYTEI